MSWASDASLPRTSKGEVPSVFAPAPDVPPIDTSSFPSPTFVPTISRGQTPEDGAPPRVEDSPGQAALKLKRTMLPDDGSATRGGPAITDESPQLAQSEAVEEVAVPEAGPSVAPQARRNYSRKPKKKTDGLMQYTSSFVPGLTNIKNPAGDFVQKEANVDVIRQISVARARREKEEADAERARRAAAGEETPTVNPLSQILIIHPGSRNLRIGRASDFYPKEVPNCIARPARGKNRGHDPPVPGSRAKRLAVEARERRERKRQKLEAEAGNGVGKNGHANGDDGFGEWVDPVDKHIEDLRDYLRNKLRANRLSTDYREGYRVKQTNAKVRPEPIPEHNDPYRIDWTEVDGKKFFVGMDALRLPSEAGFRVRYPLLHRGLNTRDWASSQQLIDDIATILIESLRTELGIHPREYPKLSAVLIVPDHGDRLYIQTMVWLLIGEMGFKEIAIHQESHTAIFAAGMSTACVVDIGATTTSVTCVDEGLLNQDTRINLQYGGDDITAALVALLTRANFPYKELQLGRSMEWLMMDNLKIRICTLEEHMVASTAWDVYVLQEKGLTQKYVFRTYDENILAPLCFFDTRMIDFEEKKGSGKFAFWGTNEDVDDQLSSSYDEPTGAMRACTTHLLPPPPAAPIAVPADPVPATAAVADETIDAQFETASGASPAMPNEQPAPSSTNGADAKPVNLVTGSTAVPTATAGSGEATAPASPARVSDNIPAPAAEDIDTVYEASKSPLDAAIAASISMAGTENKIKAAAASILLIGGGSALKGLYPFIAERLPPLLRDKGLPIQDVSIVPPPRNLNPRFVCWKGASVMCNLESLSDMWIRKDEWDAMGAKALKDRLLFL